MKTSPPDRILIAELEADNFPAENGWTTSERMGSRLQASVPQTPALLPPPVSAGPCLSRGGRSRLSPTFRASSTLAGLAAGLALIAYGEGVFNTNTNAIVPSSTANVSPAKILSAPPPASAEVARTGIPAKTVKAEKPATRLRPPSPRPVAAVKKRSAGSTRSTSEARASRTVRPLPGVERPRRRNFLGLRTVAGWITGSKSDRSDKPDRKATADKANASARRERPASPADAPEPPERAEAVK